MKPLQSIIIPTYNRKDMLAQAISSVLKQSQKNLEVIVIDDCSTDGTEDYVKSIPDERVRYIKNDKNSGAEFNRSTALRLSRGKYITFLDDDDYYTDYDFFSKAIEIFAEHDSPDKPIAIVCANSEILTVKSGLKAPHYVGHPGRVNGVDYILHVYIKPHTYRKPTSVFAALFKADMLRQIGLENKSIYDTETFLQAALLGDVYIMPDVVGIYTVHSESLTLGYKKHKANTDRLYKKINEMAAQRTDIARELYKKTDNRTANRWITATGCELLQCYRTQHSSKENKTRSYRDAVNTMSSVLPRLKYTLPLLYIIRKPINFLRNIEFLARFYRTIRYNRNK